MSAATVLASAAVDWYTPKPSWGIDAPERSFRVELIVRAVMVVGAE